MKSNEQYKNKPIIILSQNLNLDVSRALTFKWAKCTCPLIIFANSVRPLVVSSLIQTKPGPT